jgi:hypothetical protein
MPSESLFLQGEEETYATHLPGASRFILSSGPDILDPRYQIEHFASDHLLVADIIFIAAALSPLRIWVDAHCISRAFLTTIRHGTLPFALSWETLEKINSLRPWRRGIDSLLFQVETPCQLINVGWAAQYQGYAPSLIAAFSGPIRKHESRLLRLTEIGHWTSEEVPLYAPYKPRQFDSILDEALYLVDCSYNDDSHDIRFYTKQLAPSTMIDLIGDVAKRHSWDMRVESLSESKYFNWLTPPDKDPKSSPNIMFIDEDI